MSEASERLCPAGGIAVGGLGTVPDDPSERSPRGVLIGRGVGCNHLRCTQCGADVRQQGGLAPTEDALAIVGTLLDIDDWSTLSQMRENANTRTYACRCRVWATMLTRAMVTADSDPTEVPPPPWRCAGHPVPTFPLTIDGVDIGSGTDLVTLVTDTIAGDQPPSTDAIGHRDAWLARVYERLDGLPQAEHWAFAVARHLSGTGPHATGAALSFYRRYPRAPGFEGTLALQRRSASATWPVHADGYETEISLLEVFLARLGTSEPPFTGTDARALAAVQELLRAPAGGASSEHVRLVTEMDPEWAARHAADIARANPDGWPALMMTLRVRDAALTTIAGTAIAGVDRAGLKAWLERNGHGAWAMVLKTALATPEPTPVATFPLTLAGKTYPDLTALTAAIRERAEKGQVDNPGQFGPAQHFLEGIDDAPEGERGNLRQALWEASWHLIGTATSTNLLDMIWHLTRDCRWEPFYDRLLDRLDGSTPPPVPPGLERVRLLVRESGPVPTHPRLGTRFRQLMRAEGHHDAVLRSHLSGPPDQLDLRAFAAESDERDLPIDLVGTLGFRLAVHGPARLAEAASAIAAQPDPQKEKFLAKVKLANATYFQAHEDALREALTTERLDPELRVRALLKDDPNGELSSAFSDLCADQSPSLQLTSDVAVALATRDSSQLVDAAWDLASHPLMARQTFYAAVKVAAADWLTTHDAVLKQILQLD